jgi:hypothetical protein
MSRHTRSFLTLSSAALAISIVAGAALAQKKDEKKDQGKMDEGQRQEIQALLTSVDNVATGQAGPTGYPLKWEQAHFIKAQEKRTYVPFTVTLDPASLTSSSVALYLRVIDKNAAAPTAEATDDKAKENKDKKKDKDKSDARPEYAFEDVHFMELAKPAEAGQPLRISRAFSVPAGDYDVYFAMKERTPAGQKPDKNAPPAKMGVVKQTVTVPNFWAEELMTSSVILATKAEPLSTPLTPEQQAESPYAIGGAKFTPSLDGKFSKKGELNIVFWIYNAGTDSNRKPDVTIEYNFHQKTGETEKYFNKTNPQTLNAQSLPAQFDFAAGHQLPGSLTIPLASFPEGDFRLEIKVTDNLSKKSVTKDVRFNVAA